MSSNREDQRRQRSVARCSSIATPLRHSVGLVSLGLAFLVGTPLSASGVTRLVGSSDDAGATTLRGNMGAASPGDTIEFASWLNGAVIRLTSGELAVSNSVTIDGSGLPLGITVSGSNSSRVFHVTSGATLVLNQIAVQDGLAVVGNEGGGILNVGGTLIVSNSTISGNSAAFGGGIYSDTDLVGGVTRLVNCTLYGNSASTWGGGLYNNDGRTALIHCTVTSNTAPAGKGSGVASYGDAVTETVVGSSIIAGNVNSDADLPAGTSNSFISVDFNLIGSGNALGDFNLGGDATGVAAPQLGVLNHNGGPTPTVALLAGSPAINAGGPPTALITDQRGASRPQGHARDAGAFEAVASALTVTTTADSGPGSLREAVSFSPAGSAISFANGLDGATIQLSSGEVVVPAHPLTIDASALAAGITVSGANEVRVLNVRSNSTVTIDSLTITNGHLQTDLGAGVLNWGNLTLTNSTVSGNHSGSIGGGIMSYGPLSLHHSTLSGNHSGGGGGGLFSYGDVILDHVMVSENTSTYQGGGLFVRPYGYSSGIPRTRLTVNDSMISGNTSSHYGGGLRVESAVVLVENSTISENASGGYSGGGISADDSNLGLRNVTISGNESGYFGGGIFTEGEGSLGITNCTIVGNVGYFGGGIYSAHPMAMENCVVAGNAADEGRPGDDIYLSAGIALTGTNFIGNNDSIESRAPAGPLVGTEAAPLDPQLAPLADNGGPTLTMALLPGSPVRDAGIFVPGSTPEFDQRGESRRLGGALDLGAFEESTLSETSVTLGAHWGANGIAGAKLEISTSPDFTTRSQVTTVAGATTNGFVDGSGIAAKLNLPCGVAVTSDGTVYVADAGNSSIRRLAPSGMLDTLAGSGVYGFADAAGELSRFKFPLGIASAPDGSLFVADSENNRIREITSGGVVSTIAGSARGYANGPGFSAQFDTPSGVVRDRLGNLYVADTGNHCIRRITPAGRVEPLAGSNAGGAAAAGFADGTGSAARFNAPSGLALDLDDGNLYVADSNNNRIRKVTPTGVVTTVAGSGVAGALDAASNPLAAQFRGPTGVAVDSKLQVYVADRGNHCIRMVTATNVTTIAGSGAAGFFDTDGLNAEFSSPVGVAVDRSLNLYVADANNNRIRKITRIPTIIAAVVAGRDFTAQADLLTPETEYHYRWTQNGTTTVSATYTFATQAPAGTIGAWRSRMFGTPSNAGVGSNGAHADSGVLINWQEYVFGLDPNNGADDALPSWEADGEFFTITYRRPKGATDVTYRVLGSEDLRSGWAPVTVSEVPSSIDAYTEEIVIRIPRTATAAGPFFYRLEANVTFSVQGINL